MKLLIPGPVEVSSEVMLNLAKPLIGHRTPQFEEILVECWDMLKEVFRTKNDTLIITGSGTAAMDAAVASCVGEGDEIVCITGGKFGERFLEIARGYGAKVREIKVEWGEAADPERVEETVAESNAKVITLTHNETSTGVLHDAEKIGKIAREYDMIFIVDGISSVAGNDVRTDEWGIDICITGSQKCIAAPPGLAMLSVSERAWEVIEENDTKNYYLNLKFYHKSLKKRTTPFTPSVSLVFALHKALKDVLSEGLENRIKRHKKLAKATREAIKAMNLELFPREDISSNTVTAIKIPEGLTDADIRGRMLKEHGILLAGGQAKLKGKIFRIGHMGNVTYSQLLGVLSALELTLKRAGHEFKLGEGIEAAENIIRKI